MSKNLVLRPRVGQTIKIKNESGSIKEEKRYGWHDLFVLQTALEAIVKGKTVSKMSLWLNVAGKMQYVSEERNLVGEISREVTIELRNIEARKLCEELGGLQPEQFGRDMRTGQPSVPPLGALAQMLQDIEGQLGHKIMKGDEEEDS